MNRKRIIVGILLFVLIGTQVSNVIAAVKDNGFFYTNKQEISQGEILEMTLDISKIKYDKFEFKLTSNLDTNNIVINENVKAESYNNDISIDIDKSKNNLDKITFYYQVPENAQVGTKIELEAQIIAEVEKKSEQIGATINKANSANSTNAIVDNNESKTESKTTEKSQTSKENNVAEKTESKTDKNETEKNETKKENNTVTTVKTEKSNEVVEDKKIEITIVENKKSNNQDKQLDIDKASNPSDKTNMSSDKANAFTNIDKQNMPSNDKSISTSKTMPSGKVQNSSYSASTINFSSSISSQTETAVYNGSSNNYLSNIEIEGENLNTTFNKENTTYFIQTTGKTELDVNAIAEDDTAKVYITGNNNLKTGENKILISVTAKNGDVRYYRIFVTNK